MDIGQCHALTYAVNKGLTKKQVRAKMELIEEQPKRSTVKDYRLIQEK
jgi:hypothetical protein